MITAFNLDTNTKEETVLHNKKFGSWRLVNLRISLMKTRRFSHDKASFLNSRYASHSWKMLGNRRKFGKNLRKPKSAFSMKKK